MLEFALLKKIAGSLPSLAKGIALTTVAAASATYVNYDSSKIAGDEQFDFAANDIGDKEIILDGEYDAAYGESVLQFGVESTSQGYDCRLYTYHGERALYMFFDIIDPYVTKRAIGSNNAQDEDGVEISIDCLLDGGIAPREDDLKIYLGASGFSKVLRGNGTTFASKEIGFGGSLKTKLKPNTIPNDNTQIDEGYCLEYRIPYASIAGEADRNTPLGMAFVHSSLNDVTATRTRKGMSGHSTFKIPYADVPDGFIVLTGDDRFLTKSAFNELDKSLPTVMGRVCDEEGNPIENASISGHYSKSPAKIISRRTDEHGYFSYEGIVPTDDFIVTASRNGLINYTLTFDSANLIAANGAEYFQEFTLIPTSSSTQEAIGSVAPAFANSLSGFSVRLLGHEQTKVTTDATGSFAIPVYSNSENTLLISKSDYETVEITLPKGSVDAGTIELSRKITTLARPTKTSLLRNYVDGGISRREDSLYFKVASPYEIRDPEVLSLHLNTGEYSSFGGDYGDGDFRIDYRGGESAEILHYDAAGSNFLPFGTIHGVTSSRGSGVLCATEMTIPFSALGIDPSETIGAAVSFFDGVYEQKSAIGDAVAPDGEIACESTATYLRFDAQGNAHFGNKNQASDLLYYYHGIDGATSEDIPNNADRVYMTYSRNSQGISMDVTVDGDFSTHFNTSTNIAGIEAINLVLNIDGINGTAWLLAPKNEVTYDINLRLYSDNSVVYVNSSDVKGNAKDQLWWSDAAHNNGVAKNFTLNARPVPETDWTVDMHKGFRTFHLNFTYEELLRMGGAPEGATMDVSSPIGACAFEVSETSKTTVRFYTNSGDAWIFRGNSNRKEIGSFANQSNYVSLSITE